MIGEEGGARSGDRPDDSAADAAGASPKPVQVGSAGSESAPGPTSVSTEAAPTSDTPIRRLELIFGLVYGAGVEVEPFEELLRSQLDDFGYWLGTIRLSEVFPRVLDEESLQTRRMPRVGCRTWATHSVAEPA
jgi:hypothetical protein